MGRDRNFTSKKLDVEGKDGEKDKLKKRINKLEKENLALKSELRTAEEYIRVSVRFLKNSTEQVDLMKLIRSVDNGHTLKDIKDDKPKCKSCYGTNLYVGIIPSGVLNICNDCSTRWMDKKGGLLHEDI